MRMPGPARSLTMAFGSITPSAMRLRAGDSNGAITPSAVAAMSTGAAPVTTSTTNTTARSATPSPTTTTASTMTTTTTNSSGSASAGKVKPDLDAKMNAAIQAVTSEGVPVREAARKFDVPRSTLQRKLQQSGASAAGKKRPSDVLLPAVPVHLSSSSVPDNDQRAGPKTKGPRKAINCKIRMLCTSAGSALDELSNEMIQQGKSVYKLGLGQSPFPIPQCIVDELRANSHQRGYLPVAGLPELCTDIAAWASRTLQIQCTRDDVLVGPGTKELLFVLQTVYYGDLLLPNPSCTSYAPQAAIAGRNMMWLPTHAADHWVLRPEVLENHCKMDPDAPRILILNSPSNPTGCAYSEDELIDLARVARKYRILVISDELYSELHHSGQHLSISAYYPEGTIVSGGLSKWCGAGGWRMGFWVFPSNLDWLRKSMLVMASETYTSVAAPIQHAARRAFVLDCVELQAYKEKCRKTLQIIGRWCAYQLEKMCIDVQLPQGGFYLFPSFAKHRKALSERGITTDVQLCERLLHDTGVAILPGSCFGRDPKELFVRLAFVDFKGDIALYLIESMDDCALEAIDGFIQSVCPNVDTAMRKISKWISTSP